MDRENGGENPNEGARLEPHKVKLHMRLERGERDNVEQEKFNTGNNFQELVKAGILRAPRMKAIGADGIFFEAFCCAPNEAAALLRTT